jgi:aminopeptidase N
MRRRLGVLGVVAALAVPGAPGIGDGYFPTYGNGGYNVRHYDLTVRYNPASDWLTGSARITARASQDLSSFNLDLSGLTVRGVTVDDPRPAGPVAASWSRAIHELTVVPSQPLRAGDDFVVVVRYGGVPGNQFGPSGGGGVFHTDDGMIIAGEPESAAAWFPVNDHPLDKATFTFRVRVPAGRQVVANGVRTSNTVTNGWRTSVWQAREAMAPYLATVNVGRWDVTNRTTAGGLRIFDAIDPDVGPAAATALGRQEEIITFLESQFGPYPFSAAGGIIDDTPLPFALETQTRPIYGSVFFEGPPADLGTSVVVHELAHQWFGDSVSLARWRHIWLNEGFATYAEWLWYEHQGVATAQQNYDSYYEAFGANGFFWDTPIGNPGPVDLFHFSVYQRGAMTLHALRMRVGDAKFFEILRTWAATYRYKHGTTAKFVALAESISGKDLDPLFNAWLYATHRPAAPKPLSSTASPSAATLHPSFHR